MVNGNKFVVGFSVGFVSTIRSNVKSRKLERCWFVRIVVLSPRSLNVLRSSFLSLSHSLHEHVDNC